MIWLNKRIGIFYKYIYFNSVDKPWECWTFIGCIILAIIIGFIYGHCLLKEG